jgi:hypothetical protein
MNRRGLLWLGLAAFVLIFLAGCDYVGEYQFGTVIAPPAQTIAAQGGRIAQTQAARLMITAQAGLATESADLRETAKVMAATAAGQVIDTAQAGLVTESAQQVTVAPTRIVEAGQTLAALVETQAALRLPQIETLAASLAQTAGVPIPTSQAPAAGVLPTQIADFSATLQVLPTSLVFPTALATPAPVDPSGLQTQVAYAAQTAQAVAATAAAYAVAPPQAAPLPSSLGSLGAGLIVSYRVREGDSLESIARRFNISQDKLLRLNQARYPELLLDRDKLQPGWMLILSSAPEGLPIQGATSPMWSSTAGCDVSQTSWLVAPVTCQQVSLDYVSDIYFSLDCISLNNPVGVTKKHTLLQGWILTDARSVLNYNLYFDKDRSIALVGPVVVFDESTYTACGLPGK